MRAVIVGTVDHEPGNAGLAHFPEGDLLLALHWSIAADQARMGKAPSGLARIWAGPRKIGLKAEHVENRERQGPVRVGRFDLLLKPHDFTSQDPRRRTRRWLGISA
jgi:hypothetical protein